MSSAIYLNIESLILDNDIRSLFNCFGGNIYAESR